MLLFLLLFAAFVIMIGFLDNTGLYCGYQDQIHALASGNETGFCTFTGIAWTVVQEDNLQWCSQEDPYNPIDSSVLFHNNDYRSHNYI